jgi:hypothetical protein
LTLVVTGVLAGVACLCCGAGIALCAEWLLLVSLGCVAAGMLLPVVVGLFAGERTL